VFRTFIPAFAAAANPTLLGAVTLMLFLPSPKRLLLGYLLGAYLTSITIGLLIVFTFHSSSGVTTSKRTLSPVQDLVVGAIALLIAYALASGRDQRIRERRRERRLAKHGGEEKEPLAQRWLGRGSARIAFVCGVALTLPGFTYLVCLSRIDKQNWSTAGTVLAVIVANLIMLILLEAPLIGYAVAPERTAKGVQDFRAWLRRRGRTVAIRIAAVIGILLIVRGVIELLV
jgi:Sap-like sulfolipid-1-addressing protein